ncbi:AraC family transcriptional regulator [Paenibacillus sp. FSL H8-0457]|jgi:AraC family transcriptional regulator, transcriptional activator of pobA|uniref:AraC family transcriptional regulator n=1 Tax=Bacillales TaxID=1385 RepID=UPI0001789C32|nr:MULTISPECIES: AraC family transcriptional regulator [Paenibacillus]ACX65313.1 transcriptional regulator, AraC family [Paenibacillus sp. Y412MC10]ETT62756.1 AraC family transcriptional regulator [Paenibacillus sp. FSL H8-457]MCM3257809.1 AraC family transcriptional regulator [Paenibacillus lautus]MEC0207075.1 AraC family transcriptional regulator [Paenibacillus lautus]
MTNPYQIKQDVPHRDQDFPFDVFHIIPPGKEVLHLHWHDDLELIYFIRGNATFYIGSETVKPEPGDLMFVNKGMIHTGFADDEHQVEYYALVFHSVLAESRVAGSSHVQITNPYASGKRFFPILLPVTDAYNSLIAGIVKQMIAEYEQQAIGYQVAIQSMLHLLLVHLSRHHHLHGPTGSADTVGAELTDRFKELIAFVERHYPEKLTVQQAAGIVNLSEYHFCRTFKKVTGKTFVEYVNLLRINAAEQLLIHSSDPITEIAFKVGFGSVNYFSQMFRQYKRHSPSQCRKRYARGLS